MDPFITASKPVRVELTSTKGHIVFVIMYMEFKMCVCVFPHIYKIKNLEQQMLLEFQGFSSSTFTGKQLALDGRSVAVTMAIRSGFK